MAEEKFSHLQAWEQSPTYQNIGVGGGSVLNESPNYRQYIGTAKQATLRNMHFTQQFLSSSFLIGTFSFSNKVPFFHAMSENTNDNAVGAASLTTKLCHILSYLAI